MINPSTFPGQGQSRALRERVDREQRRIKREFAECSIQTEEYLESASALIEEATERVNDFETPAGCI